MRWALAIFAGLWASAVSAETVTVAVASNFLTTAEDIAADFEKATGHEVAITHGSTGQLFAQIDLGAPFDIYLAGDRERPQQLRTNGKALDTRHYASGGLALVSKQAVSRETATEDMAGRTVALADPIAAPYGKAATRAMERLKLDTANLRPVLVANVGQVATLFATGNADFAFVAKSQLPDLGAPHVLDLSGLIPEVRQDAARLARAEGNPAALAFWEWLFSDAAGSRIEAAGYSLPGQ